MSNYACPNRQISNYRIHITVRYRDIELDLNPTKGGEAYANFHAKINSETPRHECAGVLIGSLSLPFGFEINASQFGRSQDTHPQAEPHAPVTRKASPAADIDRPDRVSMSPPSALRTDIRPVLCGISGATCWAILRGIGRVYLLDRDALPLRFVGDEQR